ncbi:hypothetical protein ACIQXV_27885 [Neobacillus sp. NPDC097160]|uniref:hypothetical protein n=1 Tax=Neobacillus sp. NPDC097160 TaxID=3364298 RepID=UPI003822AC99
MFKRVSILVVLSLVLLALVLVRTHSPAPAYSPSPKSNDSSEYTMIKYKITKIEGNQYYGKRDDETEIIFYSKSIVSGNEIQVNDEVICYFEKGNLGKGLVKVEKK